jgi:hypothetical protein
VKIYYYCAQVEKDEMGILGIGEKNEKFGRPSHRWEDNIRSILKTQEMKVWDWFNVAWDREKVIVFW